MGDRGNEWQGGENEMGGKERERKKSWWRECRKKRKTTWGRGRRLSVRRGREKLEKGKEKI